MKLKLCLYPSKNYAAKAAKTEFSYLVHSYSLFTNNNRKIRRKPASHQKNCRTSRMTYNRNFLEYKNLKTDKITQISIPSKINNVFLNSLIFALYHLANFSNSLLINCPRHHTYVSIIFIKLLSTINSFSKISGITC